ASNVPDLNQPVIVPASPDACYRSSPRLRRPDFAYTPAIDPLLIALLAAGISQASPQPPSQPSAATPPTHPAASSSTTPPTAAPRVMFGAGQELWDPGDDAGRDALLSVLEGEQKASSGLIARHRREAMRMLHTPKALLLGSLKFGAGFVPVPGVGAGMASIDA